MNKSLSKFIRSDFQYYIFIILVLAIPLTRKYLPYVMFLWVLSSIISIRKIKKVSYKQLILLLFPFLFFVSHVIGLAYSDDLKNGLFDLEVKLSILVIPFVAVFITEKVRVNHRIVLKFFVLGNFIASIICLVFALNKSVQMNELGNFIFETSNWPTVTQNLNFLQLVNHRYSNFSHVFLSIFHHPTYFSVYIIFSVAILVYLIRSSKKRHILYYSLILYFSIFIWLLGSRAAYITYLISFFTFFLIVILKYKKYWIGIGVFMLGVIFTVLILSNSRINKNINEAANIIENGQSLNKDSDIRLWLWKSGIEVFNDNLLFGVGTGDIDEVMKNKYQEYDLTEAQEHNFNAHNQYLDVAVKLGLVGLVLIIAWIITILVIAIKRKQFLFFYFGLILFINFFFEAMLNTIAGVSFFAFWYSFLWFVYYNAKSLSKRTSIQG